MAPRTSEIYVNEDALRERAWAELERFLQQTREIEADHAKACKAAAEVGAKPPEPLRPILIQVQTEDGKTQDVDLRQVSEEDQERIMRQITETSLAHRIEKAKKLGLLMSDQQFEDHCNRRMFRVGDLAKYIGPSRPEWVHNSNEPRMRPHGQLGTITSVLDDGRGAIVVFRPRPRTPDDHVVDLEVREMTEGFLAIERVVPQGSSRVH